MKRKVMVSCLALTLSAAVLAGCGGSGSSSGSSSSAAPAEEETKEEAATEEVTEEAAAENTADAAETIEGVDDMYLVVADGQNPTHACNKFLGTPWLERVNELSGGAITYDLFTGGELVPLGNEIAALEQGTCDVTMSIIPGYYPALFPMSSVANLPVAMVDETIASYAWLDMMNSDKVLKDGKTFYQLEYEDNNLKIFANTMSSPYQIIGKGEVWDSVDDFSEKWRIRAGSTAQQLMSTNLGLAQVSCTATECADNMSRNAMEGLYGTADWMSYGYHEAADWVIDGVMGPGQVYIGISLDKWNSWTPEQQECFEKAYSDLIDSAIAARPEDYKAAWDDLENRVGAKHLYLSDLNQEVQDYISAAAVKTWYDWIDTIEEQGAPGKEAAILWRDCLVAHGGQVFEELNDLESYVPGSR